MIKKNKKLTVITAVITLLPMLVGVALWNQLPDMMATHWGANGEPDGYMSKAVAVFGMPVFMLVTHFVCIAVTGADPKNANMGDKVKKMIFWIAPAVSVFCNGMSYAHALEYEIKVSVIAQLVIGVMFIVIGNYLPKCKQSYTIGIKLPWTLNDAENWNKTHRMAGPVWMVGGVLVIVTGFVGNVLLILPIALAITLIPVIYSYVYYIKHKD